MPKTSSFFEVMGLNFVCVCRGVYIIGGGCDCVLLIVVVVEGGVRWKSCTSLWGSLYWRYPVSVCNQGCIDNINEVISFDTTLEENSSINQ